MDKYTVLLPPPCTNNNLHMGHLAGVYVPGDIYARFLKMQGHEVLTVCGADQNNTYTELKSQAIGVSFERAKTQYADDIRQSLREAHVHLDAFVHTNTDLHQTHIQTVVKLLMRNKIAEVVSFPQPYCPACQHFLSDAELSGCCNTCGAACDGGICETCNTPVFNSRLSQAQHRLCSTKVIYKETQLLAINLDKVRPKLQCLINNSEWTARLKQRSLEFLKSVGPFIPLTNHYRQGNSAGTPALDASYLAIWHEAIWSGISGHLISKGERLTDFIDDCNATSRNFISFMGQDTEFYYSIALSAVLLGLGIQPLQHHLIVHRFVKLDGDKFSSSRNHLIYLQTLLKEYSVDVIRLYCLSILYPYEDDENNFIVSDLEKLNTYFKQFVYKLRKQLDHIRYKDQGIKTMSLSTYKLYQQYEYAMQQCAFRDVYQAVMLLMSKIENTVPISSDIACWLKMLTPIMPSTAAALQTEWKQHIPLPSSKTKSLEYYK